MNRWVTEFYRIQSRIRGSFYPKIGQVQFPFIRVRVVVSFFVICAVSLVFRALKFVDEL